MNSSNKALWLAGLAVLFWSTVATAFKIALREFDFIQLIFYASFVTLVVLAIFLVIQRKFHLLFQQTSKQLFTSAFVGALNPLIYYLVLFKAYSLLPAQLAQPLNMVWPIMLALLSVPLLGQKIGWVSLAALFVSFLGVILISSQGSLHGFKNTNTAGVLLALGSSVFWALYWILNVRDKRDETVKLFLNFFFGFLFLAVAVGLFSDFHIRIGTSFYAVIFIGIFEAGVTYVVWLKAMSISVNNARIGNIVFLTPFLSLIFIHFVLKETIFITTFIGLVFIVAGIFVQQLDKKKS